jgi:excisionase family DNA binding protein
MDKVLLTAEEAAEALGVGRCKVFDLIRRGVLRSVKLDGYRRISPAALEEFVASLTAEETV